MYDECLIKQSGSVICPVCHTKIDWFYRLWPSGTSYVSEASPSSSGIKPITDPFSKQVRFIMTCKTCHTDIDTDKMNLLEKNM